MKRLAKFGWVLAWSCWAWVGVGLYRELPRNLGPAVGKLPLAKGEVFAGLLEGESAAVSVEKLTDGSGRIHLWDLETATRKRSLPGPRLDEGMRAEQLRLATRHAILVCRDSLGSPLRNRGPAVLDLKSGEWRSLPPDATSEPIFHPEKPWALFPGDYFRPRGRLTPQVLDLKTGERLFRWEPSDNETIVGFPFFVGRDLVGVSVARVDPATKTQRWELQLWAIPQEDRPLLVRPGVEVLGAPSTALNGRIAWRHRSAEREEFKVYDALEGRFVFDNTKPNEPLSASYLSTAPTLNRAGTACLNPDAATLWNLENGAVLWTGNPDGPRFFASMTIVFQEEVPLVSRIWENLALVRPNWFLVNETWGYGWDRTKTLVRTFAVRDTRTGTLKYRLWSGQSNAVGLEMTILRADDQGRWLVDELGYSVYRLPPSANWPLLTLCQAILATPLLMVWEFMRARRQWSAARRQSAA